MGLEIYKPKVEDAKVKMVVYGKSGIGKTTFSATANDSKLSGPILFCNVEGGMLSIMDKKLDTVDINVWQDIIDVYKHLSEAKHKYKTVVIDSLGDLAVLCLSTIVKNEILKNPKRTDPNIIEIGDYGKLTTMMRSAVRMFRDLDMHVVFTCLEKENQEGTECGLDLTPKLANTVMGMVDIIGMLFTVDDKDEDGNEIITRRMLFQPYKKWIAKDRTTKLGTAMSEPTFDKILKAMGGK